VGAPYFTGTVWVCLGLPKSGAIPTSRVLSPSTSQQMCRPALPPPRPPRAVGLGGNGWRLGWDGEANPGPPAPEWGEEDYAVLPDLVLEACARLRVVPVRDAFATPTNRSFPAFWTKAEDAFAQAWDYPRAGALFSRLDEVVTKASREGCLMLVVAPEWSGPGYQWWTGLCAPCPKRWCFPDGRPVYLRGCTDLVPASRWETWAFLLDSRPPYAGPGRTPAYHSVCPGPDGPPPPPQGAPPAQDPGADLMAAHRHADNLPLGKRPGKSDRKRGVPRFDPTSGAKPRPSSVGPPSVAGLFFPRPGRPAATPTAHAAVGPAAGASDTWPAKGCNRRSVWRTRAAEALH